MWSIWPMRSIVWKKTKTKNQNKTGKTDFLININMTYLQTVRLNNICFTVQKE